MRFSAQIVSVGAGFSMPSGRELWMALAVTLAFAGLARWVRGVTFSGAVAGAVICFVLYAGAGPGAFAALVSVFVLAWVPVYAAFNRNGIFLLAMAAALSEAAADTVSSELGQVRSQEARLITTWEQVPAGTD